MISELKAFAARKIDDGACDPVPCVEVYLKSEVDKALAELREKYELAVATIKEYKNDIANLKEKLYEAQHET